MGTNWIVALACGSALALAACSGAPTRIATTPETPAAPRTAAEIAFDASLATAAPALAAARTRVAAALSAAQDADTAGERAAANSAIEAAREALNDAVAAANGLAPPQGDDRRAAAKAQALRAATAARTADGARLDGLEAGIAFDNALAAAAAALATAGTRVADAQSAAQGADTAGERAAANSAIEAAREALNAAVAAANGLAPPQGDDDRAAAKAQALQAAAAARTADGARLAGFETGIAARTAFDNALAAAADALAAAKTRVADAQSAAQDADTAGERATATSAIEAAREALNAAVAAANGLAPPQGDDGRAAAKAQALQAATAARTADGARLAGFETGIAARTAFDNALAAAADALAAARTGVADAQSAVQDADTAGERATATSAVEAAREALNAAVAAANGLAPPQGDDGRAAAKAQALQAATAARTADGARLNGLEAGIAFDTATAAAADALAAARTGVAEAQSAAQDADTAGERAAAIRAISAARPALADAVAAAGVAVAAAGNLQRQGGSDQRVSAQAVLIAAQTYQIASQQRLNNLQVSLAGNAQPQESSSSSARSGLNDLRARTLTHLELGYTFWSSGGSTRIYGAPRCSESGGTCNSGGNVRSAAQYLNSAFFNPPSATASVANVPINGVEAFSEESTLEVEPDVHYHNWKLLALGQYSAARMAVDRRLSGSTLNNVLHHGVALGERRSGRPAGAGGSATWRGQMVGAAMDNGSMLAGESALTYSFSADTVDVRISNIRAIGDVAPYAGSKSFDWSGLIVNSDGSFHIPGYNNDRSGITLGSALHSTLGYIDGDFYGTNAEESAGIFTRGNVNGAWVARCRGQCSTQTVVNEDTQMEDAAEPDDSSEPEQDARTSVQGRLSTLRSRALSHLEVGYLYWNSKAAVTTLSCSESGGTCGSRPQKSAAQYFDSELFSGTGAATGAPINGVEAFSQESTWEDDHHEYFQSWKLLAVGQYSAARLSTGRALDGSTFESAIFDSASSRGAALGERHNGRPAGTSGSATWRGQMVGAAIDNGSMLAGESALTYSFSDNTVDVRISNIRAIDIAPYTGSTSFTWEDLSVNSDGSFYISGYNNDRSGVTSSTALHSTLGYIDGDFYGPSAEESAGIFTRGNVNGAWVAKK